MIQHSFSDQLHSEQYTKAEKSLSAETADVNGLADRNLMDVPILDVSR